LRGKGGQIRRGGRTRNVHFSGFPSTCCYVTRSRTDSSGERHGYVFSLRIIGAILFQLDVIDIIGFDLLTAALALSRVLVWFANVPLFKVK